MNEPLLGRDGGGGKHRAAAGGGRVVPDVPSTRGKRAPSRKKMRFLPVPSWLNPRASRESRDRYMRFVLPLWMFCSLAMCAPFYGFNVWVLPIALEFFGPDATFSMRTGQVLFALSLPALTASFSMTPLGTRMLKIGARKVWLAGVLIYVPCLVLEGVSATHHSIAGFWVSCAISGVGGGAMYYPAAICSVRWYREWGRPAYGSGLTGFFCGLWPAVFSFYCPLIIERYGIHASFYYNALIVLCASIPALLFLADPSEVPLEVPPPEEARGGAAETEEMGNPDPPTAAGLDDSSPALLYSVHPHDLIDDEEKGDRDVGAEDEEGGGRDVPPVPPPPMKRSEVLATPQFWVQFLAVFLSLLPGFAMKFNISVFASALFNADTRTQSLISFNYLFSYALSRLSVGLGVGKVLDAYQASVFAAGMQVPAFIGAALVVIYGADRMWAFVALEAIIGMGLAAYKVTVTLNALRRWSLPNMSAVSGLLLWGFGAAGTVGPIIGWATLSIQGDVPMDGARAEEILGQDQRARTEETLGAFFFGMAAVALLGCVVSAFFVRVVVKNQENV